MPTDPKKPPFDPELFMKGIAAVESVNGKYMLNPSSSATGLYGQLYLQIDPAFLKEYGITDRTAFSKNLDAQRAYMEKVVFGDMTGTKRRTNLTKDAVDLANEYSPQLESFEYRPDEIAALSYFLGRQGTREYFGTLRDKGKYTVSGVNKTPEEYLQLYNAAIDSVKQESSNPGTIPYLQEGFDEEAFDKEHGRNSEYWRRSTRPIDANTGEYIDELEQGGPIMAKKRYMGINPSHKGYCTPMSKSTCTPHRKALARRLKPGGDLYKGKKKADGGPLTIDLNDLPELGIGDFVRDNSKYIVGGLETATGIGMMFVPGMQGAGADLIGNGAGDIVGGIQSDQEQKVQDEFLAQRNKDILREEKNRQLIQTADANSSSHMLKYGGPINYSGQTHQGPDGGIPVDAQGNPISVSKNKPVAMVENGEVGYLTKKGIPYVFSYDTGMADRAKKIFSNYEKRLGKDFNNPDIISKEGLDRGISKLIQEQEAINAKKKKRQAKSALKKLKPGDFIGDETTRIEEEPLQLYDPNKTYPEQAQPWSPYPTQAAGIGLQAGIGALGNLALAGSYPEPEKIATPRISAPHISLARQRIQADVDATEARARARTAARMAGVGATQEQALSNEADIGITSKTGAIKAQSRMQEESTNRQMQFKADASNQGLAARTQQFDAMRKTQYLRDKYGLYSNAISSVTGGLGDLSRAYQDAQYLNVLSGRTGYELAKYPGLRNRPFLRVREDYKP